MRHLFVRVSLALLLAGTAGALAQGAASPGQGSFTQDQVTAGHKDYYTFCGECHGDALAGSGEVPPLTGDIFVADWSGKSIHDFYAFVSTAMPQGLAGDLKPEQYSAIIAYILAANGAKPGMAALDKDSDIKIGAIADGKIVAAVISGGP
jgi:mono/diheme cytochrome c family protein